MVEKNVRSLWRCFEAKTLFFLKVAGVALPCDSAPAARMSAVFSCMSPGFFPNCRPTGPQHVAPAQTVVIPRLKVSSPAEPNGDSERRRHALRGRPGRDLSGGERLPLPAVGSSSTGTPARPPRLCSGGRGDPPVPVGSHRKNGNKLIQSLRITATVNRG